METVTTSKDKKLALQEDAAYAQQQKQLAGEMGTVPANKNKNFQIPENEAEKYVHVYTEIKSPSANGKSIETEKTTIVLHADQFDAKVKEGMFLHFDYIEIIHDPRKNPKKYTNEDFKPGVLTVGSKPADATPVMNNAGAKKALDAKSAELSEKEEELNVAKTSLQERAEELGAISEDLQKKSDAVRENSAKLEEEKKQFESDKLAFEELRKKSAEMATNEGSADTASKEKTK